MTFKELNLATGLDVFRLGNALTLGELHRNVTKDPRTGRHVLTKRGFLQNWSLSRQSALLMKSQGNSARYKFKDAVLRITYPNLKGGSGFVLTKDERFFIATADHVVYPRSGVTGNPRYLLPNSQTAEVEFERSRFVSAKRFGFDFGYIEVNKYEIPESVRASAIDLGSISETALNPDKTACVAFGYQGAKQAVTRKDGEIVGRQLLDVIFTFGIEVKGDFISFELAREGWIDEEFKETGPVFLDNAAFGLSGGLLVATVFVSPTSFDVRPIGLIFEHDPAVKKALEAISLVQIRRFIESREFP